ncbi:MAG TPA: hypothetical protein VH062_01880 [Polyangiaceae bacterium]|jgi:hypothetical protein|nr:hypothetical protein [Polyangiaceae bacterium]
MAKVLRPSLALLKRALHREVDRCVDEETVGCFEAIKANSHIELYEYSSRKTPFARRLKTAIFAVSDQPERRKLGR